ncbi:hypothetical protein ABDK56_03550 [Sphingomonas sp. ASV193]|uniref:hypothetical protein n=1 Tax=Sphingomonas sp. ASV193 TaxID=3144405 RepID=UPI0032E8BF26
MDDAPASSSASDTTKSAWWERASVSVSVGVFLGVLLIVAEDHGYGGLFEWSFGFIAGTTIAVAVFWERRHAPWFIPAVALLILAQIGLLGSRHWSLLPSRHTGLAIQLKGVAALDFAVSASFLWCVHRLFDPREGIKAHWSTAAQIAAGVIILMFMGLFAGTALLISRARDEKLASSKQVFAVSTPLDMATIIDCLDDQNAGTEEWTDARARYPTKSDFNQMFGRTIRLIDMGGYRLIQVETSNARPLRQDEKSLVQRCSA